jgi:prepilin-type N-terminal cleavage/methylation domain-containing protein
MRRNAGTRRGYSLLEIVIVVMIVGIIATIAAPKLLGTSQQAVDNGLRQTLSVIRTAIDSYSAEKGGILPGADGQQQTLKDDLVNYLRGKEFPICPAGAAQNNAVRMLSGNGSIAASIGGTAATHSWVYKYETGDFHVNSVEVSADGVTTYDQF